MRTLHLYLTRQALATSLMTVAVFTFVLLLGNVVREIFLLLLNRQATLTVIGTAMVLLIPYVLVFALPMGLLTAMLLTFGRLSADQELIAMRGGGISLLSLVSPVLLLALGFGGVCAFINLYLAPTCRMAYKDLVYSLSERQASAALAEGRFVKDIPGYIIYAGKFKDGVFHDLLISQLDTNGEVRLNLRAACGSLVRQEGHNQYLLRLQETSGAMLERGAWQPLPYAGEWEYPLTMPKIRTRDPKLNEMTFFQLREEYRQLERAFQPHHSANPDDPLAEREARRAFLKMVSPVRVQMHHQVAFSFACLGFTLISIPLGIRGHRKETSVGVAISLLLILVYYSFFIMAQALAARAQFYPHLLCWFPNLLFQLAGAILLWRVNRQ